jgi:alanyl-tRNA synthetase
LYVHIDKAKDKLQNEKSSAIIREMSKLVGGKPGIAQGGGTDASKIEMALEKGVEMVREKVG